MGRSLGRRTELGSRPRPRPPRTDRQRADRVRTVEAGQHIQLESRERARASAHLPWQERASVRRPASKPGQARNWMREYVKLAADKLEADRIRDQQLQQTFAALRASRNRQPGR